jgi:hypothetical protein
MKFHSTRICSAFGAAICFVSSTAFAQESARHVRFLPLGDPPPYMQEVRDGVAYEIDPPEGTLPPREVVVGNPKPGEEEAGSTGDDSAKPMSLRLGSMTSAVKVPGGEGALQLRRAADVAPQLPWLSIKRPAQGDFMVYLWRRTGAPTWNEISHLIVPDGAVGAPAGTVRITNLFPQTISMFWGKENLELKAGDTLVRRIEPGTDVPFAVVAGGKRYFSSTVTQNKNERGWITLYRADAEQPRRPLKVSVFREPVIPYVRPKTAAVGGR